MEGKTAAADGESVQRLHGRVLVLYVGLGELQQRRPLIIAPHAYLPDQWRARTRRLDPVHYGSTYRPHRRPFMDLERAVM